MIIQQLKINNFRSIEKLNIECNNCNVICFIGENGSSKTSVLSLISEAIIMNSPLEFPNYKNRKEKRYRKVNTAEINYNAKFYSFEITYKDILNQSFAYKKLVSNDISLPEEEYNNVISGIRLGNHFWGEVAHRVNKPETKDDFIQSSVFLIRPGSRHEPYELDYNNPNCDIDTLESKDSIWGRFPYAFEISYVGKNIQDLFLDMAFDSVIGYKDAQFGLAKIQDVLTKITGKDFGRITVTSSPYRSMVFESVGRLESLSQGEMDILVTISSIIKRQVFIYRKYSEDEKKLLELDDFFKVPGFVLIDEVDLHLHPRAQEKYIKVLTDIFPNITFILTTHSPFVIRGLPDDSVVVSLPSGEVYKENFKAMDIDSITNIIFGYAGGFSEDVRSKLNLFKLLLADENKNIEELKSIYDALVTSESAKEEMDLLLASYSNIDFIKKIK